LRRADELGGPDTDQSKRSGDWGRPSYPLEKKMKAWAVIMAGGSGTRFWPESRKHRAKQFLNLLYKFTRRFFN